MTKIVSKATALKNLKARVFDETLSGSRGFSFKSGDGDPRELQTSDKKYSEAISKIKIDLFNKNFTTDELLFQLAKLTIDLQVMQSDNTFLRNANQRFAKAAKEVKKAAIESSQQGAKNKNALYVKNKESALAEYLKMSNAGEIKISPERLLKRLETKYPTPQRPWKIGTLKDWVVEFRKILSAS